VPHPFNNSISAILLSTIKDRINPVENLLNSAYIFNDINLSVPINIESKVMYEAADTCCFNPAKIKTLIPTLLVSTRDDQMLIN